MVQYDDFADYQFCGCYVRKWNIISFAAQKRGVDDPLELRDSAVFFYYPDESKDDKWAHSEIGEALGIHGCAVFEPDERWVYLTDDGQVYVVGFGDDDFEDPINKKKGDSFFSNIKSIRRRHAYAVGGNRKVYRRDQSGYWTKLDHGLPLNDELMRSGNAGFQDIDGFSEHDIYACGGNGDLWRYDGRIWSPITLPTNACLERLCCGEDGYVYILTNIGSIVKGRQDNWWIIDQDETEDILENIVCFENKIYISTADVLYELKQDSMIKTNMHGHNQDSFAHIASGDGILVTAGRREASIYDGSTWKRIV